MIEAGDENEGNNFTVDWEGPDDPSDPKKSGLPMRLHRAPGVKLTNHPLQLDIPQEMGRDRLGIRLHFPEPRLIRHDRTSRTRDRSGVSYSKLRRDCPDSLHIRIGIRCVANIPKTIRGVLTDGVLKRIAFGPLLFAPLSEIYGRARLLQTTNVLFLGG